MIITLAGVAKEANPIPSVDEYVTSSQILAKTFAELFA